jgi:hypothetical protein
MKAACAARAASFFGSDAFQSLDAGHLIDTHRVRIKLSQQLGSLEIALTHRLHLLVEHFRVGLFRIQPVP